MAAKACGDTATLLLREEMDSTELLAKRTEANSTSVALDIIIVVVVCLFLLFDFQLVFYLEIVEYFVVA
eukprot:CAMPEP_0194180166 /NCGR_PEP_ID=MMETSP0154-20130528/14708_1 /TAXON_ID=1049557 /ORGANISM="Thalassiothrix antarctica, Strain L6-D1" /LENGTH=68 /DNA_ID=CAMNT_0038895753 /DNA_START=154 /DNA_END=356 /DNA_ORIENTATION=+